VLTSSFAAGALEHHLFGPRHLEGQGTPRKLRTQTACCCNCCSNTSVVQVVRAPDILTVIRDVPNLHPFLFSLYQCHYGQFFKTLGTSSIIA
jgi:hypothetical protein